MQSEPSLTIHRPGRKTTEWTIAEYAAYERVDERTVRRWVAKGAILVRKTPGGGIRVLTRHE